MHLFDLEEVSKVGESSTIGEAAVDYAKGYCLAKSTPNDVLSDLV